MDPLNRAIRRLLCVFVLLQLVRSSRHCPPVGPVFPAPRRLADHPLIRAASANLTTTIDLEARNGSRLQSNTTSFSINVQSIHEEIPSFQYHYTAPVRNDSLGGTTNVTADTVYRIGSITKVLTALAVLLHQDKIRLNDPITNYVPELAKIAREQREASADEVNVLKEVAWDEITVQSLLSHLSGIGRTYAAGEIVSADVSSELFGLPAVNASQAQARCGRVVEGGRPCSREEFLTNFPRRYPVFPPYAAVSYSNVAFAIVGAALETVTNQSYETLVTREIFEPLQMSRTSVVAPLDNSWGIRPFGPNAWDLDLGFDSPAGSVYSSTNDLTKLGRAILQSTLLRPSQTRRWLKPQAHTASLELNIGAPWEIVRLSDRTPDGRAVDLYLKGGGLGQYQTLLALIPDYDVVMTFMSAGPPPRWLLVDIVVDVVLPAIDEVSREQAARDFSGRYISSSPNASLSVAIDRGPGLKIQEWTSRGRDILQDLASRFGNISARLYPAGVTSFNGTGKPGAPHEVGFRAIFEPESEAATGDRRSLGSNCASWGSIDAFTHDLIAIDDIVFQVDPTGRAVSVNPRAWRTILQRAT